jgi:gliding motility-associated-like protein
LANVTYRFEFHVGFVNNLRSPPINISFFGTPDCENLPFGIGDDDFGCPTNDSSWVKLGSTRVSGGIGDQWVKASIEVSPKENMAAIAIGPDCPPVQTSVSLYYFFDNLLLADTESFELRISAVSHPCQNDFTLSIPSNDNYSYQWYKDGIALIGETSPLLSRIFGEGDYQVRIDDGVSCRVSLSYTHRVPVISAPTSKTICKEDFYPFGDLMLNETGFYVDTFKSINNCDSIVRLDLKVLDLLADTVSAKIFEGDSYNVEAYRIRQEGDHLLNLTSSQGCDSLLFLELEYYNIFIPSAFSPNYDGINDVFKVFGEEGLIESKEMIIFDRWGNQLHRGTEWDGTYRGAFVQPGVFIYLVQLRMNDGQERQFSGSVTLLR